MILRVLERIDGRGYKAYRDLLGRKEEFSHGYLEFVRVQGDPFASPSVVRFVVSNNLRFGKGRVGAEDFLYRRLHESLRKRSAHLGEGKSGYLGVPKPSHAMLRRGGVRISGREIEFRFLVGLPARHRRVLGNEARDMLGIRIPEAIREVMGFPRERFEEHIRTYLLQEELRESLKPRGLVSFIADGSILPRRCGTCEEKLDGAVPFESPESLRVEIETTFGNVTGMGIPKGITVIAGTAFHGKSTLLNAIRDGIYDHIPGDGREKVVTVRNSFKIRAEEGRCVRCVDISTFIYDLPDGRNTECFTTDNASGATSMASGIQEMVEAGAELLLIDEDTSATNLLFYDERTSHLFRHKTVSTVAEKARDMANRGISLVIVSSGSLPLLESSDTLIVMEDYLPRIAEAGRIEKIEEYLPPADRKVISVKPAEKPRVRGPWIVAKNYSREIRMDNDEQIVEESQLFYLSLLLSSLGRMSIEGRNVREIAEIAEGLDFSSMDPRYGPGLAEIRGLDFVFALNRVPEIRFSH